MLFLSVDKIVIKSCTGHQDGEKKISASPQTVIILHRGEMVVLPTKVEFA